MINREVTVGVTPRGNPMARPAYWSTCSTAPAGSFHFLIYSLASNSRSCTFQVNKLFPLGCPPLFARSCHHGCPPDPTLRLPGRCANYLVAPTETTWSCSEWRKIKHWNGFILGYFYFFVLQQEKPCVVEYLLQNENLTLRLLSMVKC